MSRYFALIGLLLSLLQAQAQSLKESYTLGCELYELGDLEAANILLNRVVYFDDAGTYKSDCYYKLAKSHIVLQEYTKAFKYYEMAIVTCSDEQMANDRILEKSLELIKQQQFLSALQELYSLYDLNTEQQQLCDYLTATALFGNEEYVDAEPYFLALVNTPGDSLQVQSIFAEIGRKLHTKRPRRARNMSYILPGLGQLYAGNLKGSINSALLIGGIGVLYFATLTEYGLISAFITVLPWLSRYHVGGAENAKRAMIDRQLELKSRYFEQLLVLVR